MKNFFIAFFIFLIWSFFGLWLFYSLRPIGIENGDSAQRDPETDKLITAKENDTLLAAKKYIDSIIENQEEKEDPLEKVTSDGLKAMTESGDIIFLFDEGIGIEKNSVKISVPSSLLDFKYKINSYLIEHPYQELQILSYYDVSENLTTPNFGEYRGMEVIKILESLGIVKERMVVKPIIKAINFDDFGKFNNGISFIFSPINEDRFKSPTFNIPPVKTIHPKFVNNDIFADKVLKEALEEAKVILANYPDISLEIIGHTDNVGNAQDNYVVGLKYAQQVRWYFISAGKLDKDRVKASSQGESQAIASNGSERGRLLNRRIEIKYILNQ